MYTIELDLSELIALQVAAKDKAVYYSDRLVKANDMNMQVDVKCWHDSLTELYCAIDKLNKA